MKQPDLLDVLPPAEPVTPETLAEIESRVAKKRRLRLMLMHIQGARCLMPLVADLDNRQLDAMLNLAGSTETLESL